MKNRVIVCRRYSILHGEPSNRIDYLIEPFNHFGQELWSTDINDAVLLHETQTTYKNEFIKRSLEEYEQVLIPAVIKIKNNAK